MKTCCFTGHRTIPLPARTPLALLLDKTIEGLIDEGYTEFRAGGALGFDMLAALRVLRAKEKHPDVRLHLILPCRDQAKSWREGERLLWQDIIDAADTAEFLFDTYKDWCMYARNRALIEGSDLCIAYLTSNRGGTFYTCSYAEKQDVPVLNLAKNKDL